MLEVYTRHDECTQDFDATPYTYVDTPAGLRVMAERLAGVRELAVDLEHHSHRSYQVP